MKFFNKNKTGNIFGFIFILVVLLIAVSVVFYYIKNEKMKAFQREKEVKNNILIEKEKEIIENNSIEVIEKIEVKGPDDSDSYRHISEAHWTHMPLKYFIVNEEECGTYETNKIKRGFKEIIEATNSVVDFEQIFNSKDADITLKCSFIENCYEKKIDIEDHGDYYIKTEWEEICDHKKGVAQITEYEGNKILKAEIELIGLAGFSETTYKGMSGFYIGSCGHTTTEIHEILHTFNYGHYNNSESIMYYMEDGVGYTVQGVGACIGSKKQIDDFIVKDLIKTYTK
jgi:hypothetical protein